MMNLGSDWAIWNQFEEYRISKLGHDNVRTMLKEIHAFGGELRMIGKLWFKDGVQVAEVFPTTK